MAEFGQPEGKEPRPEAVRFEDELVHYLRSEPFHPLEMVTTSGDKYEITSPLQVAIGENVVVVVRGKYGVRMIRKNQIVAVHVHEPAQ